MFQGVLVSIHIAVAKTQPMQQLGEVRVTAGSGLKGDRYSNGMGTFSAPGPGKEITLIEIESIEALREKDIMLPASDARRNLVTRGVPLNHLVGRTFQVGEVRLRGVTLCEPCSHLERLTRDGVLRELAHRGGLRADIVSGGVIRVGDAITERAQTRFGS
jgi:MOSC domain-containing protein YiiM